MRDNRSVDPELQFVRPIIPVQDLLQVTPRIAAQQWEQFPSLAWNLQEQITH
jgi:hypothetical protein